MSDPETPGPRYANGTNIPTPVFTIKAGMCDADFDVSPPRIKPLAERGFLYIYSEDDLVHLCWRKRDATVDEPELDLIIVPQDATFVPYTGPPKIPNKSPIPGRVFVLKFHSSSERKFFWLQSREQPAGDPTNFSTRDLRLGKMIDNFMQNNEIDDGLQDPLYGGIYGPDSEDERRWAEDHDEEGRSIHDEEMEDVQEGEEQPEADTRNEGEDSREGGAGGRAVNAGSQTQMNNAIQDFLKSLGGGSAAGGASPAQGKAFTTLPDLLPSSTTIPMIDEADETFIDNLLAKELPTTLIALEMDPEASDVEELDQETAEAVVMSLDLDKKKALVKKVLRSPQFAQSLMSTTGALRDGGLPNVAQALGVNVKNGGYTGSDRRMPLEGGDAVEAFLKGAKDGVKKSQEDRSDE